MTIMETLRAIFGGGHAPAPPDITSAKVDAAIEVADQVATQSRAVNDKLKGYLAERDPFMALLIDISNERAARQQMAQWDD